MGSGQTIVVFDEASDVSGWKSVNDDVMGGCSSGSLNRSPGGLAVFSGTVSLDNGGGFASVRSPTLAQDFNGRDSFLIRIRGDGHRFKFNVRSESRFSTQTYQCAFDTHPGEWEECRLPFAAFVPTFRGRVQSDAPALNAARIRAIGFLIGGRQHGPFRLEIDWVKAS